MLVLVAGSTGLIGSALMTALQAAGHEAVGLSRARGRGLHWNPDQGELDPVAGFEGVVNLCGATIGGRFTDRRKALIRESRVKGTDLLARAMASASPLPQVLVNGSAVGYYGNRGDTELTEESPAGGGFLSEVCRAWEGATAPAWDAGVRVVSVRTGLVLDGRGGVLPRVMLPVKLGVGGKIGDGRQWWSWISLEDEVRAIMHCLTTPGLEGPVNLCSPEPLPNRVFMKKLAKALHRPALVPAPAFALRALFSTETANELLLSSQRVMPAKLATSGFVFRHPTLDEALAALL